MSYFNTKKRQLGQGMTEYIIIVALVSVAAIGVYSAFGEAIRGQMANFRQGRSGWPCHSYDSCRYCRKRRFNKKELEQFWRRIKISSSQS